MVPELEQLQTLSNPLATVEQLSTSGSQLDGVPADLETSVRFAGAQLTQAAGILLRLPQEIITQAIVIYYRFYLGSEGGSFLINAAKDVSAAAVYMTAKVSFLPQSTRSVTNVYTYLTSPACSLRQASNLSTDGTPNPQAYYLTEGSYHAARNTLLQTESIILRSISFITHVVTPHHLALTYLQTLGVLPTAPTQQSTALAARTIAYLNIALISPQLLYLTHQPLGLAVASIYLAAREVGVKLPSAEWWEVFDVDREELGFLVVALGSCEGFVERQKEIWSDMPCPLTVEDLKEEIRRRENDLG